LCVLRRAAVVAVAAHPPEPTPQHNTERAAPRSRDAPTQPLVLRLEPAADLGCTRHLAAATASSSFVLVCANCSLLSQSMTTIIDTTVTTIGTETADVMGGLLYEVLLVLTFVAGALFFSWLNSHRSQTSASRLVAAKLKAIEHDDTESEEEKKPVVRKAVERKVERKAVVQPVSTAAPAPKRANRNATRKPNEKRLAADMYRKHNQQICAADSAGAILRFVGQHSEQMNEVNLATALHRVARWTKREMDQACSALREQPEWKLLLSLVEAKLTTFNSQGLANGMWALATVRVNTEDHASLLAALTAEIEQRLARSDFAPQALANTAWACATLRYRPVHMLQLVEQEAAGLIKQFNPQDLANIVWAYATLGEASPVLLEAVASAALNMLYDFKPQELSNLLWAFATVKYKHSELFEQAVPVVTMRANSDMLNPQALANISWAYASMTHYHAEVMHALLQAALNKLRWFTPQELSNMLWACATLRHSNVQFMNAAVNAILSDIGRYNAQDIANTCWAMASQRCGSREFYRALSQAAVAKSTRFYPKAIANTLWAFATLSLDEPQLFAAFAAQSLEQLAHFNPTDLSTVAWAFSVMNIRDDRLLAAIADAADARSDMKQAAADTIKAAFERLHFDRSVCAEE